MAIAEGVEPLGDPCGQIVKGPLWPGYTDFKQTGDAVEVAHREAVGVMVAVEPDVPKEEGIDNL